MDKANKSIKKIILMLLLFSLCLVNSTALAVEEDTNTTVEKTEETNNQAENKAKTDTETKTETKNNEEDTNATKPKTEEANTEKKKETDTKVDKTEETNNTNNKNKSETNETNTGNNNSSDNTANNSSTTNTDLENKDNTNNNNTDTNNTDTNNKVSIEAKLNEITFTRSGTNDYILGVITTNKKFEDVTIVVRDKASKKELGTWKSSIDSGKIYFDRNITGFEGEYEVVVKCGKEEKVLALTNVKNESNSYKTVELKKINKESFILSKIKESALNAKLNDVTFTRAGTNDYIMGSITTNKRFDDVTIVVRDVASKKEFGTWKSNIGSGKIYFDRNMTGFVGKYEIVAKYGNEEKILNLTNVKNESSSYKTVEVTNIDKNSFTLAKIKEAALNVSLNDVTFTRAGTNDYIMGSITTNKRFDDVTIVVRDVASKKEFGTWKSNIGSGKIYFDRNMTGFVGKYEIVAKYGNEEKILNLTNVKNESNSYKTVEVTNIDKNSFTLAKIKEAALNVSLNDVTFTRAGTNDYIIGSIHTNKRFDDVTVVVRDVASKKEFGTWKSNIGSGKIYFDRNMTGFVGKYEIVAKYGNEEKILNLTNVKNESDKYESIELKNLTKNSFELAKISREIKVNVKDITVKNIGEMDYLTSNLYVRDYNVGYKIYLKNVADGTLHETWMSKNGTDCYFDKNLTGFTGEFKIIIKTGDGKEYYIPLNNWRNDKNLNTFIVEKNNKTFILKPFTKEYVVEPKDITFRKVNNSDYLMGNIAVYNKVGNKRYDAGKIKIALRNIKDNTVKNTWYTKGDNNTYYFDINLTNTYGKYEIVLFNQTTKEETIIALDNAQNYKDYASSTVTIIDKKQFELEKPKREVFAKVTEGKFTSTENADYFIGTINAYNVYKGVTTKLNNYSFVFKDVNTKKEYKMFTIDTGNNNYYVDLNLSTIPTGNYNIIAKDGIANTDVIVSNVKVEKLQTLNITKISDGYTLKRKSEDLQLFLKNTKFKAIGGRDYIQADAEVYFLDNGIRKSAKDKFDIGIKNLKTGEIRKAYIKNVKGNIYYTDININDIEEVGYTLIGINKENQKEINLHIRYDKPFLFLANNKVYDIKGSNFKIKRLKPYTLNITDYLASPKNYTKEGGRPITEITIHHMAMVASAEKCGRVFQNPNHEASTNYGIGVNGEIGRYVADTDIPWSNAHWESNKRAITIEVSDESVGGRWPVSKASMNTLIELVAQIARRYDINLVKGVTLTWHRLYSNTNCPGSYLLDHMDYIVEEARKRV